MIIDRLNHAACYARLGKGIAAGLDYLKRTDFTNMEAGKHVIDGDNLYAMVQRFRTKSAVDVKWESHRKYIDIQYIIKGTERMGWLPLYLNPKITKPYDATGDAALYEGTGSMIDVRAGEFIIFCPDDVHAPGLSPDGNPADVFKVVVKVKVDPACAPCGF